MSRAAVGKRQTKSPKLQIHKTALVRRLGSAGRAAPGAGGLPLPPSSPATRLTEALGGTNAARSAAAASLAGLACSHPVLSQLLGAVEESAPYLRDLVRADAARALRVLCNDPDARFALLLASARRSTAAARNPAALMRVLRRVKAEAALLIALADIGNVWSVERVTRALTDLADTALRAAVRFLLHDAAQRGMLEPPDPHEPEIGSGLIVLAMGKMGAGELNFSSDIDLMVFFDPAAAALSRDVEPALFYIRLTQQLLKLIGARTADGYVFRVDLRLRPDPSSTQIAIPVEAALEYYESRGQNWERAALIKARPCAGDLAAGEQLVRDLSPFVWRKYLDFATVADVHEMKRQIHAYRGHGEIAVEGHNIKLGRGGIREIEFFAQTQQLIAGGRHSELRGRSTVAVLQALAAGGWIDAAARDELTIAYDFLRRLEHRLQMLNDEQTHSLPSDPAALEKFARFFGFAGRDDFAECLLGYLRIVERHYVKLFEREPAFLARQHKLSFSTPEREGETLDRLAELGFRQPQQITEAVRRWRTAPYQALRSEQARNNLTDLLPAIIDQVSRAENPDFAFAAFDGFLNGLRAGGRFLSLFRQNPQIVDFIALILRAAPRLADTLSRNPHLIDPLIDPSFFGALPDADRLADDLARALGEARRYEDFLDAIRLFGQEHLFLVGARILSGSVSAEQAGEVFAGLAEVLVRALNARVEDDFALLHGRIRGQRSAILALGRLGAREMTASSDLDLIVIYDFDQESPSPTANDRYTARSISRA